MSDIRNLKYLIYDEDPSQFSIMRMILQQIGCGHLEFASNHLKARRLFEEQSFDIAIVTLRGPNEDSWKFVTWLRSPNHTAAAGIPVLGLLTRRDNSIINAAIRKGVNYIVLKPFSFTTLSERIDKTLNAQVKMAITESYYGPCRRRLADKDYAGPNRRIEASLKFSLKSKA